MNARYINCEVQPAALGDAARGARAMGWRGFNCSIPHKVAIIDHLDWLGDSAATIGAVNCAVRRGDKWIGENTDGVGFMESLKTLIDVEGKSIVVFGAGGAARAIAVEAALAGARRITIVNRSQARGAELTELINAKTPAKADVRPVGARPIAPAARTTCSSTRPRSASIPTSRAGWTPISPAVKRDAVVADVIPNPPRTLFLRDAEAQGLRDARRARHAGQSGRRVDPPLVWRRRRGERHAAHARRAVRRLEQPGRVERLSCPTVGDQAPQRPLGERPRPRVVDRPGARTGGGDKEEDEADRGSPARRD